MKNHWVEQSSLWQFFSKIIKPDTFLTIIHKNYWVRHIFARVSKKIKLFFMKIMELDTFLTIFHKKNLLNLTHCFQNNWKFSIKLVKHNYLPTFHKNDRVWHIFDRISKTSKKFLMKTIQWDTFLTILPKNCTIFPGNCCIGHIFDIFFQNDAENFP